MIADRFAESGLVFVQSYLVLAVGRAVVLADRLANSKIVDDHCGSDLEQRSLRQITYFAVANVRDGLNSSANVPRALSGRGQWTIWQAYL